MASLERQGGGDRAVASAETVAALRAAVARDRSLLVPCTDHLAQHFLGLGHRLLTRYLPLALLRPLIERISPGSYCFAVTRTRHFDGLLLAALEAGVEQVLILGAGYDSRAWRFADALREIPVFEVDHPGTQARKRRLLARSGQRPTANTVYLPVDFTRQSFAASLAEAGFSRQRSTFVLWEGVSYYLPRPVVQGVLAFVSSLGPGSSIAFDYALASFVAGDHDTYGGRQVARWLARIGEPFLFGLEPAAAGAFLAECGLQLVSQLGPGALEEAYLATHHRRPLGRSLGHVYIAHARVRTPAENGRAS